MFLVRAVTRNIINSCFILCG